MLDKAADSGQEEVGICLEISSFWIWRKLQERVVATLAYTNVDKEDKPELVSPSEAALQQKLANNPVYRAFENVHDVDDLYRIADLWLNPAATASRAVSSWHQPSSCGRNNSKKEGL